MSNNQYIYMDNASTSFPKPYNSNNVLQILDKTPATLNRRGYSSSYNLNDLVESTRSNLKEIIGCPINDKLIFLLNSTQAINMALRGTLNKNDHVITTNFEHASVSRTLTSLRKEKNIEFSVINVCGLTTTEEFEMNIKKMIKPNTRMLTMNHGSNVTGEVLYKAEFGEIAHKYNLIMFVDASQSVGNTEINLKTDNIDIMAFSCHKSLMSMTGVGALYFKNNIRLRQLITGGTGVRSESDEITPTEELDFETGTMNIPGLVSLNHSLRFISKKGISNIINKKRILTNMLLDKLMLNENIIVYGLTKQLNRLPIISFNIKKLDPVNEVGPILENVFNIVTRTGLHCSPWTHKKMGTFPMGTIRISPGFFNTQEDIEVLTSAIASISKSVEYR